jgi:Predicted Fe-S-cluster oxidoreductase
MTLEAFLKTHSKITRSLKKFVLDYEAQLDADTFAAFLENLSEEIKKAAFLFSEIPAGPERAFKLHALVEEEIAAGANIEVSCTKGCSACCHMEVEVTSYEADVIAGLVREGHVVDRAEGTTVDRERLRAQSSRSLQDPAWKQGMFNQTNRCVFLNSEGACSIYEKRPVMCRRHSVTSPAKNCEDFNAGVTIRYFPKVDLLISAANEDSEMQIGPLAKMVQMRL